MTVVKQAQVAETNVQSTVNAHHSQTSKRLAIDHVCVMEHTHRETVVISVLNRLSMAFIYRTASRGQAALGY